MVAPSTGASRTVCVWIIFFFSSRRRHTRFDCDWSSDVCSSDLDSLDLRRTMIDLLTEQVAGYFDPDSNALYIPTDIDPSQARLVISHELVHALQHQYLNLEIGRAHV